MPNKGRKRLRCEYCDSYFMSTQMYNIHTAAHEESTNDWQCSSCCKTFLCRSELEEHIGTAEHRLKVLDRRTQKVTLKYFNIESKFKECVSINNDDGDKFNT